MGNKHTEAVDKSRRKNQIVEVRFRVPLSEKQEMISHADQIGKPLATYIRDLIRDDMKRGR